MYLFWLFGPCVLSIDTTEVHAMDMSYVVANDSYPSFESFPRWISNMFSLALFSESPSMYASVEVLVVKSNISCSDAASSQGRILTVSQSTRFVSRWLMYVGLDQVAIENIFLDEIGFYYLCIKSITDTVWESLIGTFTIAGVSIQDHFIQVWSLKSLNLTGLGFHDGDRLKLVPHGSECSSSQVISGGICSFQHSFICGLSSTASLTTIYNLSTPSSSSSSTSDLTITSMDYTAANNSLRISFNTSSPSFLENFVYVNDNIYFSHGLVPSQLTGRGALKGLVLYLPFEDQNADYSYEASLLLEPRFRGMYGKDWVVRSVDMISFPSGLTGGGSAGYLYNIADSSLLLTASSDHLPIYKSWTVCVFVRPDLSTGTLFTHSPTGLKVYSTNAGFILASIPGVAVNDTQPSEGFMYLFPNTFTQVCLVHTVESDSDSSMLSLILDATKVIKTGPFSTSTYFQSPSISRSDQSWKFSAPFFLDELKFYDYPLSIDEISIILNTPPFSSSSSAFSSDSLSAYPPSFFLSDFSVVSVDSDTQSIFVTSKKDSIFSNDLSFQPLSHSFPITMNIHSRSFTNMEIVSDTVSMYDLCWSPLGNPDFIQLAGSLTFSAINSLLYASVIVISLPSLITLSDPCPAIVSFKLSQSTNRIRFLISTPPFEVFEASDRTVRLSSASPSSNNCGSLVLDFSELSTGTSNIRSPRLSLCSWKFVGTFFEAVIELSNEKNVSLLAGVLYQIIFSVGINDNLQSSTSLVFGFIASESSGDNGSTIYEMSELKIEFPAPLSFSSISSIDSISVSSSSSVEVKEIAGSTNVLFDVFLYPIGSNSYKGVSVIDIKITLLPLTKWSLPHVNSYCGSIVSGVRFACENRKIYNFESLGNYNQVYLSIQKNKISESGFEPLQFSMENLYSTSKSGFAPSPVGVEISFDKIPVFFKYIDNLLLWQSPDPSTWMDVSLVSAYSSLNSPIDNIQFLIQSKTQQVYFSFSTPMTLYGKTSEIPTISIFSPAGYSDCMVEDLPSGIVSSLSSSCSPVTLTILPGVVFFARTEIAFTMSITNPSNLLSYSSPINFWSISLTQSPEKEFPEISRVLTNKFPSLGILKIVDFRAIGRPQKRNENFEFPCRIVFTLENPVSLLTSLAILFLPPPLANQNISFSFVASEGMFYSDVFVDFPRVLEIDRNLTLAIYDPNTLQPIATSEFGAFSIFPSIFYSIAVSTASFQVLSPSTHPGLRNVSVEFSFESSVVGNFFVLEIPYSYDFADIPDNWVWWSVNQSLFAETSEFLLVAPTLNSTRISKTISWEISGFSFSPVPVRYSIDVPMILPAKDTFPLPSVWSISVMNSVYDAENLFKLSVSSDFLIDPFVLSVVRIDSLVSSNPIINSTDPNRVTLTFQIFSIPSDPLLFSGLLKLQFPAFIFTPLLHLGCILDTDRPIICQISDDLILFKINSSSSSSFLTPTISRNSPIRHTLAFSVMNPLDTIMAHVDAWNLTYYEQSTNASIDSSSNLLDSPGSISSFTLFELISDSRLSYSQGDQRPRAINKFSFSFLLPLSLVEDLSTGNQATISIVVYPPSSSISSSFFMPFAGNSCGKQLDFFAAADSTFVLPGDVDSCFFSSDGIMYFQVSITNSLALNSDKRFSFSVLFANPDKFPDHSSFSWRVDVISSSLFFSTGFLTSPQLKVFKDFSVHAFLSTFSADTPNMLEISFQPSSPIPVDGFLVFSLNPDEYGNSYWEFGSCDPQSIDFRSSPFSVNLPCTSYSPFKIQSPPLRIAINGSLVLYLPVYPTSNLTAPAASYLNLIDLIVDSFLPNSSPMDRGISSTLQLFPSATFFSSSFPSSVHGGSLSSVTFIFSSTILLASETHALVQISLYPPPNYPPTCPLVISMSPICMNISCVESESSNFSIADSPYTIFVSNCSLPSTTFSSKFQLSISQFQFPATSMIVQDLNYWRLTLTQPNFENSMLFSFSPGPTILSQIGNLSISILPGFDSAAAFSYTSLRVSFVLSTPGGSITAIRCIQPESLDFRKSQMSSDDEIPLTVQMLSQSAAAALFPSSDLSAPRNFVAFRADVGNAGEEYSFIISNVFLGDAEAQGIRSLWNITTYTEIVSNNQLSLAQNDKAINSKGFIIPYRIFSNESVASALFDSNDEEMKIVVVRGCQKTLLKLNVSFPSQLYFQSDFMRMSFKSRTGETFSFLNETSVDPFTLIAPVSDLFQSVNSSSRNFLIGYSKPIFVSCPTSSEILDPVSFAENTNILLEIVSDSLATDIYQSNDWDLSGFSLPFAIPDSLVSLTPSPPSYRLPPNASVSLRLVIQGPGIFFGTDISSVSFFLPSSKKDFAPPPTSTACSQTPSSLASTTETQNSLLISSSNCIVNLIDFTAEGQEGISLKITNFHLTNIHGIPAKTDPIYVIIELILSSPLVASENTHFFLEGYDKKNNLLFLGRAKSLSPIPLPFASWSFPRMPNTVSVFSISFTTMETTPGNSILKLTWNFSNAIKLRCVFQDFFSTENFDSFFALGKNSFENSVVINAIDPVISQITSCSVIDQDGHMEIFLGELSGFPPSTRTLGILGKTLNFPASSNLTMIIEIISLVSNNAQTTLGSIYGVPAPPVQYGVTWNFLFPETSLKPTRTSLSNTTEISLVFSIDYSTYTRQLSRKIHGVVIEIINLPIIGNQDLGEIASSLSGKFLVSNSLEFFNSSTSSGARISFEFDANFVLPENSVYFLSFKIETDPPRMNSTLIFSWNFRVCLDTWPCSPNSLLFYQNTIEPPLNQSSWILVNSNTSNDESNSHRSTRFLTGSVLVTLVSIFLISSLIK